MRSSCPGAGSWPTPKPRAYPTAHGDFYDDQALVSGRGPALIDLDELRRAHPAIDAANMLAHLSSGRAQGDDVDGAEAAFREAVLTRDPTLALGLATFEAAALVKLAPGPFRRLEPDWPEGIERILVLAERCLERVQARALSAPVPVHDPLLPHLSDVMDPATVMGCLAVADETTPVVDAELDRYKAGRRAIVRFRLANGEHLYGKTFASQRGPRVYRIAR